MSGVSDQASGGAPTKLPEVEHRTAKQGKSEPQNILFFRVKGGGYALEIYILFANIVPVSIT